MGQAVLLGGSKGMGRGGDRGAWRHRLGQSKISRATEGTASALKGTDGRATLIL